ncbi:MAG: hypothetical protein HY898_26660 [Deltaproteobacteria bacterium]|nr:hypothetical protein [Deltaproteobacteria bacterium]
MKDEQEKNPSMTIVGGQTQERNRSAGKVRVPVGVEKLLHLAARDSSFRERLLADPLSAAESVKVRLRSSEELMLRSVPPEALASMIAAINPDNPRGRRVMGLVAAAAASLAAGTALVACSDESDSGSVELDAAQPMDAGGMLSDTGIDGKVYPDGADADADAPGDANAEAADDADADAIVGDDVIELDGPQPMDAGGILPDTGVDGT